MGLQIFQFSRDDEMKPIISEQWTPWGGGRWWWLVDSVSVIPIFLGSGGGVGMFMEVVWSYRRSGTPWRSLVVAAISEMNGSMP